MFLFFILIVFLYSNLMRDGRLVVGTWSGELMLLEADSIQKQMDIGSDVNSAVEVEDKLYVGTVQKIVIVDLKSFTRLRRVRNK